MLRHENWQDRCDFEAYQRYTSWYGCWMAWSRIFFHSVALSLQIICCSPCLVGPDCTRQCIYSFLIHSTCLMLQPRPAWLWKCVWWCLRRSLSKSLFSPGTLPCLWRFGVHLPKTEHYRTNNGCLACWSQYLSSWAHKWGTQVSWSNLNFFLTIGTFFYTIPPCLETGCPAVNP